MATILFNAEDIGDAYAPSLNAAFRELYLASGQAPRVKAPLGGKRTLAQALAVPGAAGRNSDHFKGRAVDIDNQRWFRNWNETRFLAILAKYGWHNVQINGRPFPSEPWHFANQSTIPQGSSGIPLGSSGPISIRTETENVELYGTTSPAIIPAPMLALNSGLAPGKPTYFLIPGGPSLPRVTQDQNVASAWSQQQFGQPSAQGIVSAGWPWCEQMFNQAATVYNATIAPQGSGGVPGVPSDLSAVVAELGEILEAIEALPADLIEEQKKPGN